MSAGRVVVVGAGIVGASVAYHAARAGAEDVELISTQVGARPMPADGEPIIGPVAEVPGLYLAVMHSAVTLAAAAGRLVAREVVEGTSEPLLTGCRLDRFSRLTAGR